jgi:hypothetical protein
MGLARTATGTETLLLSAKNAGRFLAVPAFSLLRMTAGYGCFLAAALAALAALALRVSPLASALIHHSSFFLLHFPAVAGGRGG